jgi:hypothetical protein
LKIKNEEFGNDDNTNTANAYLFSKKQMKDISKKILNLGISIEEKKNEKNTNIEEIEKMYIYTYLKIDLHKTFIYFFGFLFGTNLFFIASVKKKLNYKIPYKASEEFVLRLKKLSQIRKILFFSLILYEAVFGLLVYQNYKNFNYLKSDVIYKLQDEVENKYIEDKKTYLNLLNNETFT